MGKQKARKKDPLVSHLPCRARYEDDWEQVRHYLQKRKEIRHISMTPYSRNLDLTKCQGTGEIGSLYRGFFISCISRFFSIHNANNRLKIIVRYTEDFVV